MKLFRNVLLVASVVALSGCTAFSSFSEVDALNDAKAVGSPFTQALADEYRTYANVQLKDMMDYPDALHFSRKGLAAAAGDTVLPEPIADWNLSDGAIQELSAARGRLIVAFDLGARETAPPLAARAQAAFDCWIEQQEETWGTANPPSCKNEFVTAMTELESKLQAPPPVAEVVDTGLEYGVDASKPMELENAMYLVFFDWDRHNLTTGAQAVIDSVVAEVQKNPPTAINVVGHTDTSGPNDYNNRLAVKRANAVRDELVKHGVAADMINVSARGEDELMVATPDNVREPANRRANISFQ
jgi:OOP family OmpA-OmpF porin